VSGPTRYRGLDIKELWTIQGGGHNKATVSFLRKEDLVGEALQTKLAALQLQAGVSWPVLSRNGHHVRKYVPKCHASHTWAFNDKYDLTIDYDEDPWVLPQCEHDQFIMEEMAKLPDIKARDLKYIQRCRIFLQATTVADVTTSYGTKLAPWVTTYGAANPRTSTYIYPNQARPNRTVWNVFVKQLRKCFCQGTNDRLNQPLGRWYRGRISQIWPQVYSPSTRLLYNAEPNGSLRLYRSRRRGTIYRHIR